MKMVTPQKITSIGIQLANKCNTEEDRQQALEFVLEILESNSIASIDGKDICDSLDYCGHLIAFETSVSATATKRMDLLIEQIKEKTKDCYPIFSFVVYLFCPEDVPLLMGELQSLNDWLSSITDLNSETQIKWGMGQTPLSSNANLRAIVLAITDEK